MTSLEGHELHIGYGDVTIIEDLSLVMPEGAVTSLVGPNGCGKSTLLNALARLLKPKQGTVLLDGRAVATMSTKEVARRLAFLPQSVAVPPGVTVRDLVGYGRYPHQGLTGTSSTEDLEAIEWAMEVTETTTFASRMADSLSGGERQRAWIAMALAQKTGVLLLDEPTTFLDIKHQLGTLSLVRRLNEEHGITVGMVLHELNQAVSYSDNIVMMCDGAIVASGLPADVMTPSHILDVFGVDVVIMNDPRRNVPLCLPYELRADEQAGTTAVTVPVDHVRVD